MSRFLTRLAVSLVLAFGVSIGTASAMRAADEPITDTGSVFAAQTSNTSAVHPDVAKRLAAQDGPIHVWVAFRDKGISSAQTMREAIADAKRAMSPRTLQRRARRGRRAFNERDVPVHSPYVDAVLATGARYRVTSRWLNALSVTGSAEQIEAIAALPFVETIQAVGRGRRQPVPQPEETEPTFAPMAFMSLAEDTRSLNYGSSYTQLDQIQATALHNAGLSGAGVVLAVLDTGFYKDHESIQTSRIVAEWDFVNNDANTQDESGDPSGQHNHGTACLSIAAGRFDGKLYGPAYNADLILCKTETIASETQIEEDWYVAGVEFAELHGADVLTSSLGYINWYTQAQLDGQTAVTTVAVNLATANGLICVTAAGNEGTPGPSLIAPADAFDVITVGAVNSLGDLASFSSRGPTADGRVKPEVVAHGVSTYGARGWSSTAYGSGNGTSYATPLVAGVIACLLEAHPDWGVAHVRAALFDHADYYVTYGTYDPAYGLGYGLIDAWASYQTVLVPPDFDLDEDVDADDLAFLMDCATGPSLGPPTAGCEAADLDGDDDVDQSDFGLTQRCFNGAGNIPASDCMN